ncbi:sulfite exporter TauE/SafE family protein [Steroidobacter agaridevorans]|uniref:sulfite exporter TauE/SafE family protein n=1 Tax=Steroidobacter agaridevorans TaxID=2695856 RepID=UPI0013234A8A|nr:sulfite exporter TauE/SafE family protein [Steroidobacter agaridevorans]GFE91658.1 cytochrome biogenesis protein [Steroidobacter agaridevorans]
MNRLAMPDASAAIGLSAAFVAGVAGSAHCFAMCGGLAGALGMRSRVTATSPGAAFGNALSYHVGRLSGYATAGAICGLIGATLQAVLDLARIGAALRIASGVLLMLIALRILSPWNPLRWLETFGAKFWRRLQPFTLGAGKLTGHTRAIALGFLWGWLPCGLVYSMLLFAALGGHALNGAAILFVFGLGTLPSMLTSSVLASQMQRFLKSRWPRFASGALLLLFGAWMIWVSIPASGHVHHH